MSKLHFSLGSISLKWHSVGVLWTLHFSVRDYVEDAPRPRPVLSTTGLHLHRSVTVSGSVHSRSTLRGVMNGADCQCVMRSLTIGDSPS